MKYILTLFLVARAFLSFGQGNINYNEIIKWWIKVEDVDLCKNISKIDSRMMHGFYYLVFSDTNVSIITGEGFCGNSIYEHSGMWWTSKADSLLTVYLTKVMDHQNGPSYFQKTLTFKIKKLEPDELILQELLPEVGKTLIFTARK